MWAEVAIAYVVDLAFGDPQKIPHPVVLIGRLIAYIEKLVFDESLDSVRKRLIGAVAVVFVVGMSFSVTWGIVALAAFVNKWLGFVISVLLIATTIATKGLMDHAKDVADALEQDNIEEARLRVGRIVGRDTGNMARADVVRATIESVAENSVDGVLAPIMYAIIGGAPLAMAYKAINTLDSMIGYKNERYQDFGWAAAKLDDVANYIPARISVFLLAVGALFTRGNALKAIKTAFKDGRNHASPNSGYPEAAVAGAIGLTLGGTNYYAGVERVTGFIGDGNAAMTGQSIKEVNWLLLVASAMTVLLARAIIFIIGFVRL